MNPLERLRHHVTGAIERGEKTAIAEKRDMTNKIQLPAYIYELVLYDTAESLYLDRLEQDGEWKCILAAHADENRENAGEQK